MDVIELNKYVVTAHRIPLAYNDPTCYVVEAANEDDAFLIVKDNLRDFSEQGKYKYTVKPYVSPPQGRIISTY